MTSQRIESVPLTRGKKLLFFLVTLALVVSGVIIGGELVIRIFAPQTWMFPRWKYSTRYGSVFPANTTIQSGSPGRWEFSYTTNKFGCRGEAVPLADDYEKGNIVVLGDSFSFGQGVNDGEEYPAILGAALKGKNNVINLSCPGWGLTQQLRRYHDLGRLYHPGAVILQYCANDLMDNYHNMVTGVEEGRLTYRDTDRKKSRLSILISKSELLQKSQIYCFIRNFIGKNIIYGGRHKKEEVLSREEEPPHEKLYADLLEAFARELRHDGTGLIIISPLDAIDWFPYLKKRIEKLEAGGLITYLKTNPWFEGVTDYGSPEGHYWGKKAHDIVGRRLADIIRK